MQLENVRITVTGAAHGTGRAKDTAPVVVFLASDAARFMTGQIIPVDGGPW